MFTRLTIMEVIDEMKKVFGAMKHELKKGISICQKEMRASQDEMKESHNAMKMKLKEIATGQDKF